VYLIDTNVISEIRKGPQANRGVRNFFRDMVAKQERAFLSVITVGELRRGVETIRHRGDVRQARRLEQWLDRVVIEYSDSLLSLDADAAQVWGRLCAPHAGNTLDKQIAATALLHDLAVVTRNEPDFAPTGVRTINPFSAGSR
jgi:hypothetical protein